MPKKNKPRVLSASVSVPPESPRNKIKNSPAKSYRSDSPASFKSAISRSPNSK